MSPTGFPRFTLLWQLFIFVSALVSFVLSTVYVKELADTPTDPERNSLLYHRKSNAYVAIRLALPAHVHLLPWFEERERYSPESSRNAPLFPVQDLEPLRWAESY